MGLMCRYALYGPYKGHYACFNCRKSFKWPRDARQAPTEATVGEVKCPQCAGPMADMGKDFKAPKLRDTRQWRKVEMLFLHGYTYHSCGGGGPGYRPRTLREVPGFLDSNQPGSGGAALLRRIQERSR